VKKKKKNPEKFQVVSFGLAVKVSTS